MKKWVVLQGIISANYGQRFWTKNHENPTQSDSGETWYKVILETDDEQEAKQVAAYGSVFSSVPWTALAITQETSWIQRAKNT